MCIKYMELSDIVEINKQFDTGTMINSASLDFAVSSIKRKGSWLEQLAFLVRALLVDHPFKDGNKRTTTALVLVYFDENNIQFDKDKTIRTMIKISAETPTDTRKIEKELKRCMI
jgi:fido (protein-threonine AMPylation protein)